MPPLPGAAIRALFPGIGLRIEALLRRGERLFAEGRISEAASVFRDAARIDPEDEATRAYLHEAESTIALAAELAGRAGEAEEEIRLDPRMTAAQLAAAEARLRDEKRTRRELLATLAALGEDARPPEAGLLATLAPVEIPDADARSEVHEAGAADRPALRLVFDGAGAHVVRVEVDDDADGHPERIVHYRAERVSGEARDTNGDGRLDTFDRLDATGRVALREEDLDGDGAIDVRSAYRDGRLIRRELSHPEPRPDS